MTLDHTASSLAMSFPNSSGRLGAGSAPSLAILSCISRSRITLLSTALSFAIGSTGVRAGAMIPNHDVTT